MYFNDTRIGHQTEWDGLERDFASESVAHAYLFHGPAHIGKSAVAVAFAKLLQCGKRGCTGCTTCSTIEKGIHADTRILHSEEGALSIDAVRSLNRWMRIRPTGKHKVCVIADADRINREAFQALLKTLEEPPSGTVILMTTAHRARIPATILSRVRLLPFRLVPHELIEVACAGHGGEPGMLQSVRMIAEGQPGTLFSLLADRKLLDETVARLARIRSLESLTVSERFQIIEQAIDDEKNTRSFFHMFLAVAREKMRTAEDADKRVQYVRLAHATADTFRTLTASTNVRLDLEQLMLLL